MAAVTRSATTARPAMPPGYEDTYNGITIVGGVALEAGDVVYLDGTNGWKAATAVLCRAHQCGIAAQDYAATETGISILLKGEMDNYADDLTPGQPLWVGAVAGDMVDAAPVLSITETVDADGGIIAVPDQAKIYAQTATRIRFSF